MIELTAPEQNLCRAIACRARRPNVEARHFIEAWGEEAAWSFALGNELVPHLAHALLGDAVHTDSDRWAGRHQETQRKIQSYLLELDRIGAEMNRASIPVIALKNAGITRALFDCPGCSPMGDLDILVRPSDFRRAHQLLIDDGYEFEFRSDLEDKNLVWAEKSGGAEYWKILASGEKLWLELQWRPVAGRWIRSDQEPDADDLFARSQPIEGTQVRLMAPEDNLLQVSLHTAKHSYVRAPGFRLHTDVDRLVHRDTINWDRFVSRVYDLGVKRAVYYSLAIPKMVFGSDVPDDVLSTLRPTEHKDRRIWAAIREAGLFHPHQQKFSKLGYIVFNMLMYDDVKGLARGVFPPASWMREKYGCRNRFLLPYYHGRRILDLLTRRQQT